MEDKYRKIIDVVMHETKDGSISWDNDINGFTGKDSVGNFYYLTTMLPKKEDCDIELSFIPELRIEGEKITVSIKVIPTEEDPKTEDLNILLNLDKEIRKKLIPRHMYGE